MKNIKNRQDVQTKCVHLVSNQSLKLMGCIIAMVKPFKFVNL